MCIQWTPVIYSVEIKRQFNPPFHNSTVCVMNLVNVRIQYTMIYLVVNLGVF